MSGTRIEIPCVAYGKDTVLVVVNGAFPMRKFSYEDGVNISLKESKSNGVFIHKNNIEELIQAIRGILPNPQI